MMGGSTPDPDGYEGRMAKGNLFKMAEYSMQLHNMIQDEQNLEPWVQEKIAVAASMMDSVAHYMQYEKVRGPQQQQQAMPVQVTTIGE
jgi:ribosomal protein L10